MLISNSQNISVSCFIILIVISLSASESLFQAEFTGCSETCLETFNRSGNYSLKIREDCDEYCIDLDFEAKTSIIDLTASIEYHKQYEDRLENSTDLESTFEITLTETTTSIKGNGSEAVLLEKWSENNCTRPCTRKYLSRSSTVFIRISGTGNWSYYKISFSFNEIQYRLIKLEPQNGMQMTSGNYSPNSVSLLLLPKSPTPLRGVKIWFDNLIIDTEKGEYILIGAGTEPFKYKYSRPLYITEVAENTTFFVDDSSAFVAYVSGSVRNRQTKDFKILWEGIEKDIDSVVDDPNSVKNSSLICFFNYSEAIKELEEKKEKSFEAFRRYFANVSMGYLQGEYKNIIDPKTLSVRLFGPPTKIVNENGLDILAILIKVMYKNKSIFTWRTLQSIIEESQANRRYEVGLCPQKTQYELPYKREWNFIFYALVPVFGLFALMMWAWKQNLFAQNCLTEKEEKLFFSHAYTEPNPYTTTIPKIRDEEDRTKMLTQGPLQQENTERTKNAAMIEMNDIHLNSKEKDTLKRYLSNPRKSSRPSIQSLLDNVEEIKKQSQSSGKSGGNESDHLYDSVSSSKELNETRL